jgi:kynurenine formamidase
MCHHCVIESVKQRMLSRRDLFKAAPAVAVAAAATATAAPVLAAGARTVEDLTHELHHDFPTYFGTPGITLTSKFNFAENGFNLFELALNEHTGTHIDAPLHFSADGQSVAEIPVENLVAPLAIVDIRARAATDPDTLLTPDDLKAWIAANGPLPDRCCVAMNSGWDAHVSSDKFRGADAEGKQHYPGFHVEAAQMLLEESTAIGIASDTLSLDHGISANFATHYAWLPTNRWGLENVANLGELPAVGATIMVGAPKWRGGSGGPSRVVALV